MSAARPASIRNAVWRALLGSALLAICLAGCAGATAVSTPTAVPPAPTPLPAAAGRVTGKLVWNAQPAPGVEVRLCDAGRLRLCPRSDLTGRTDANGVFVLDDIPAGAYAAAVQAPPSADFFYLTSGAFIDPALYRVAAGMTLDLGIQPLYRLDLRIHPVTGDVSTGLRLAWDAYPGADYYEVSVAPAFGEPVLANARVASTTLEVAAALPDCAYSWWVEAFDEQNGKLAENGRPGAFDVAGGASCVIDGLAPDGLAGVAAEGARLSWAAHPAAVEYRVTLWSLTDQERPRVLDFAQATLPELVVQEALAPGAYAWVVIARDGAGRQVAGSQTARFAVGR
jgi:hypothetical protein